MELYEGIARCVSELSDTEIDRITRVSEVPCPGIAEKYVAAYLSASSYNKLKRNNGNKSHLTGVVLTLWWIIQVNMEKTCFVLAYLTSQGRVPLLSLNDVIAGVVRGWPSHRVGWLLLQAFYQCRLASSSNTGQKHTHTFSFLMFKLNSQIFFALSYNKISSLSERGNIMCFSCIYLNSVL